MGVDYYTCDNCGETFPDCGEYIQCEHGHYIGPCCFPRHNGRRCNWSEDQLIEDHDEYGECLTEQACPVCAKGGDDQEKIRKLAALLSEARSIISASSCSDACDEAKWDSVVEGWVREVDTMLEKLGE